MKTLRRYLFAEILSAIMLVCAGLLMLFALFDLIRELDDLGHGSYKLTRIIVYVLLSVPGHLYELLPIAVLIGTLFALAQLVANSEYTVMRVSGVSVGRMLWTLVTIGFFFAGFTFICGEFIAPPAEEAAQRLRTKAITGVIAQEFRSGLWVKDEGSFVNVSQVMPDATLSGIKVYELDSQQRLRMISLAQRGEYKGNHQWVLHDVVQTTFQDDKTSVSRIPEASWRSVLDPGLLNVLLVSPEKMSAWNLYSYIRHLRENNQKTTRHEIALWNKLSYLCAVLVMMVLALPFSYFQQRVGNVGAKVFSGIMLGLGFSMMGRLFTYFGLLRDWTPVMSSFLPTLIFLMLAMGMLWWEERR